MIAITPRKERPWCIAEDLELPVEERTYWLIRDLTERERVRLNDAVEIGRNGDTGAVSSGLGSRTYITLKSGLIGIAEGSAFPDENGNPVAFQKDASGQVHDEFLARIPWPYQLEIFVAITSSAVMEEEEKEG